MGVSMQTHPAGRWLRIAGMALLAAAISACGSKAPVTDPRSDNSGAGKPATTKPPTYTIKKGGGFYLDDGPGDNPPENLDAIPNAVPKAEPLHRFANNPYSVLGQDYVPLKTRTPYRARGVASWYGKKFHGQKTASGEPYDMYAMTAAHPTLPIPSYVRVSNPGNGRWVILRVNDRGPFLHGRLIDLSYAAAWKLGYVGTGSTLVEVEATLPGQELTIAQSTLSKQSMPATSMAAVKPAGSTASNVISTGASAGISGSAPDDPIANLIKPLPAPKPLLETKDARGVYLQLGAFGSAENAEILRGRVARLLGDLADQLVVKPGGGMYRLQLGPWKDHAEALRVSDRITDLLEARPVVVSR